MALAMDQREKHYYIGPTGLIPYYITILYYYKVRIIIRTDRGES